MRHRGPALSAGQKKEILKTITAHPDRLPTSRSLVSLARPYTPHPQPSTLNPQPPTLNSSPENQTMPASEEAPSAGAGTRSHELRTPGTQLSEAQRWDIQR